MFVEGNSLSVGGEYVKVERLHPVECVRGEVGDQVLQQQARDTLLTVVLAHTCNGEHG